jgi:pyruvate formate lyase activating enzyme
MTLHIPLTLRIPLVPGFNASVESLQAIAEFVVAVKGTGSSVDLLPYHTLGKTKYQALSRQYPWEDHKCLNDEEIEHLANVFKSYGLTVNIGG